MAARTDGFGRSCWFTVSARAVVRQFSLFKCAVRVPRHAVPTRLAQIFLCIQREFQQALEKLVVRNAYEVLECVRSCSTGRRARSRAMARNERDPPTSRTAVEIRGCPRTRPAPESDPLVPRFAPAAQAEDEYGVDLGHMAVQGDVASCRAADDQLTPASPCRPTNQRVGLEHRDRLNEVVNVRPRMSASWRESLRPLFHPGRKDSPRDAISSASLTIVESPPAA